MHPLGVRPSEILQRQVGWQFDLRSAIIGALVAWIAAGVLYSQRRALAELARRLWAPVAAWRRRIQASQEEKYIQALKGALKPLLLLAPSDPSLTFIPPTFRAFAPLPKTIAEVGQTAWTVTVSHEALMDGHNKVVVTGFQGSGRTTSLLMSVGQATEQPDKASGRPYRRLPIWIDLARIDAVPQDPKADAVQQLAQMATAFLPDVLSKWLVRHLKNEPTVVLLDNWEVLTPEQRLAIAGWIAEADEIVPDAVWIVAAATSGYGYLVEAGFMPAELLPTMNAASLPELYEGWRTNLGLGTDGPALDEDADAALAAVIDGGAPLWELHLRVVLHLTTGELPERQSDVMAQYLASRFARVDLGKGSEDWASQAVDSATEVLSSLAAAHRIDGEAITSQHIREAVEGSLPPREERSRRLEGAVRKILADSGLLRQDGKHWALAHHLFTDFLAARYLAGADQEEAQALLQAHRDDPTWLVLTEFYAGLADAGELADLLILAAESEGDRDALLRAARWGIVADPQLPWRKRLIKALAQAFMEADLTWSSRLSIGHALSLVAGEGARSFFLRMLRHTSPDIRCAAIRGVGWAGSSQDLALLTAALRDNSTVVQTSAIDALRDTGTEEAIAVLAASMPQVNETLMLRIAEALASHTAGWEALANASEYPDLLVRRAVAHGLGLVDEPWAEERLLEIGREDAEWLVRSAAESAIQAREERSEQQIRVTPPPRIDAMDWLIAWAARQGQGLGVGEAARETLLRAAEEGNVDAKALSALTLAQIGRQADLALLEVLGRDRDADLQRAATWALEQVRIRYRSFESA